MEKPIYKKWWFILIAVLVVLYFIGLMLPDPEKSFESKESEVNVSTESEEKQPAESEEEKAARTEQQRAVDSIKFVEAINKDIIYFDSLSKVDMVQEAGEIVTMLQLLQNIHLTKFNNEIAKNKDISKLLNKERDNLKKVLRRQYDVARKLFAQSLSNSLFDSNIEVKYHKKNREMVFIGGTFANNANKTAYKDELSKKNLPSLYRIQELTFKWYSGDNGTTWTYQNIAKDDEILSQ